VKITQNPLGFGRDLPTTNDHFPFSLRNHSEAVQDSLIYFFSEFPG
jgi:hypothetical protein